MTALHRLMPATPFAAAPAMRGIPNSPAAAAYLLTRQPAAPVRDADCDYALAA